MLKKIEAAASIQENTVCAATTKIILDFGDSLYHTVQENVLLNLYFNLFL